MAIPKGKFVTCIALSANATTMENLTIGRAYEVVAAEGDHDIACGGRVQEDGLIIIDDEHDPLYIVDPTSTDYDGDGWGRFELVL